MHERKRRGRRHFNGSSTPMLLDMKWQQDDPMDTKSGHRERGERPKANSREGDSREQGQCVMVLRAGR